MKTGTAVTHAESCSGAGVFNVTNPSINQCIHMLLQLKRQVIIIVHHCYVFLARVATNTQTHTRRKRGKSHSETLCDCFSTSRPGGLQAKARYGQTLKRQVPSEYVPMQAKASTPTQLRSVTAVQHKCVKVYCISPLHKTFSKLPQMLKEVQSCKALASAGPAAEPMMHFCLLVVYLEVYMLDVAQQQQQPYCKHLSCFLAKCNTAKLQPSGSSAMQPSAAQQQSKVSVLLRAYALLQVVAADQPVRYH
jgi:hypothetical protein